MSYNVGALDTLVEQFERIPGIGHKSAQRMAFYVLNMPEEDAKKFAESILGARNKIHHCKCSYRNIWNKISNIFYHWTIIK